VSDGILIDGEEVHVTTLLEPERPSHEDPGSEHGWIRDSAVQLWTNMVDREASRLPRDRLLVYMSPEELMGKLVDETSYVYSIGVIAYELLTKRLPFEDARGAAGLITAQLKREPRPPSNHAEVPTEVDELILRCLRKLRSERFANLHALACAIDERFASAGAHAG
jgi:hypothetical protein